MKKHEDSARHKEALQLVVVLPACCQTLVRCYPRTMQCLLKVLSNIRFLARQGIALCGDGDENDSNFIQLLKLRGLDDPRIEPWLQRKTDKYISHDLQNELLKVMALSVLREIAASINRSTFFCVMSDECTDSSNREQLVTCIRWINDQLEPHEDFIGLYQVDICADTLVAVIKNTLIQIISRFWNVEANAMMVQVQWRVWGMALQSN